MVMGFKQIIITSIFSKSCIDFSCLMEIALHKLRNALADKNGTYFEGLVNLVCYFYDIPRKETLFFKAFKQ